VTAEAAKARVFLEQMGQANYPPPAGVPDMWINEENQLLSKLRVLDIASQETNLSAEKRGQFSGQRQALQDNLEIFGNRW